MKYTSTKTHHILTKGPHRVAIERVDTKKINAANKKELAESMRSLLEFRDSEPAHVSHKKKQED